MKIELENGVWLADGQGDPPRTLERDSAKEFNSVEDAISAMNEAKKLGHFENARIRGGAFV